MNPFQSYQLFSALKLHFTSDYDFIKYRGKTRCNIKSFEKAKGKFFYGKLAATYPLKLQDFYVSVFAGKDDPKWIGDFYDSESDDIYLEWQRVTQSLFKMWFDDVEIIKEYMVHSEMTFKSLFFEIDGKLPIIHKLVLNENIRLETVVILNMLLKFIGKRTPINPLTIKLQKNLTNYEPFVIIDDLSRYGKILDIMVI